MINAVKRFLDCSTQLTTVPELADKNVMLPTTIKHNKIIVKLGSNPCQRKLRRFITERFSMQELLLAKCLALNNQAFV